MLFLGGVYLQESFMKSLFSHTRNPRRKLGSLRYKDYIAYYRSRIMMGLLRNRAQFLKAFEDLWKSQFQGKSEVEDSRKKFLSLVKESLGKFNQVSPDLKVNVEWEPGRKYRGLFDSGYYRASSDILGIRLNFEWSPGEYKEIRPDFGCLFKREMKNLFRILGHELIHRAQILVDGEKFTLWEFLKSKLSFRWYLENPKEIKSFSYEMALELAQNRVFHVPDDFEGLFEFSYKSQHLQRVLDVLVEKKIKRKHLDPFLKILVNNINKWLAYFKDHLEDTRLPRKEAPHYGEVRKKNDKHHTEPAPAAAPRLTPQRVASLYLGSKSP